MRVWNFDLACLPVEMDLGFVWEHLRHCELIAGQTRITLRLIPDELIYAPCWPYYHQLVAQGIEQFLSACDAGLRFESSGWRLESSRVIFSFLVSAPLNPPG